MATADIAKQAVFDGRIVQHPARYAVDKGALSLTNAPFNAISASASQFTFNVNVPSQNVFVDRAVDWSATTLLALSVQVNSAVSPYVLGQPVLSFGKDCALAPFPLHQLTATMTATINDTSVVINTDTVLKEVLRLTDYKKNRLVRTCPTMLDKYASYNDAYLAVNSPLASYLDATESADVPNGAWYNIQFCDSNGAVLSGSGNYTVSAQAYAYVNGIPVRNTTVYAGDATYPIFIQFFSTEKLVLSPFIFADAKEYETGLFGINNMQLVMNLKGGADIARVVRYTTGNGRTIASCALANYSTTGSPFQNARINVQFLTPSLDIPLPPKSVVPYMEFPRYISNNYQAISAGVSTTLSSQTIVLPQIPDMLIIYVKPQAYADASVGDFYLPITGININFDNFSGLLSSHTTEELYRMSVHNGLEMDFGAWRGRAYSGKSGAVIQTVGGFLVLKPGQDITLQAGQAPGLIGNFTLQFNATVENTSSASQTPVLYVITCNSGFFETLAGSSRIVKGVLSEADIISAEPVAEVSRDAMERMVGGGFFDKIGSMLSKGVDIYNKSKPIVSGIKGFLPETGMLGKVKSGLGAVGYGQAGAGLAGGKKSLSARLM
jgi:hypothetical protein